MPQLPLHFFYNDTLTQVRSCSEARAVFFPALMKVVVIRSSLMTAPILAHTLPREAQSPADEHRKVSGAWSARPPPPAQPQTPPSSGRHLEPGSVAGAGRAAALTQMGRPPPPAPPRPRHPAPASSRVPAPGPGCPVPTDVRTAFLPRAPPPRPGPSAPHPFLATSERRPRAPPRTCIAGLPLPRPAQQLQDYLLGCLGVLFSAMQIRVRSLAPSSRLPSSPPPPP